MKPRTPRGGSGRVESPHTDGLIDRVLAGDERAARALYDAHRQRAYGLALRLTGDEELARECTQQAFTRAFLRLSSFRRDSSFATWLHRVTVNTALSQLRQLRRSRATEQDLDVDVDLCLAARPAPGERDPMLRERIRQALDTLPDSFRVVVLLHDVEGFTHEEIGKVLDIASGTSKARLSRARARLRLLLAGCAREYAA